MTDVLRYMLTRPTVSEVDTSQSAFDRLYQRAREEGGEIAYNLPFPRWQFLCYLADTKPIVLHGSGTGDIALFEPRKSNDINAFGDRQAVYAASDGLWPLYFAILDREQYPMTLHNSCARQEDLSGMLSEPFYFFSITAHALDQSPWRRGWVYLLPRDTFESQPPLPYGDTTIHIPQWASLTPVRPLARLAVGPEDFPFLDRIRGHDDAILFRRAKEDPTGFPWIDGVEPQQ